MNLKGVTKIELFDLEGNKIKEQIDENITTDLNKKLTEYVTRNLQYINNEYGDWNTVQSVTKCFKNLQGMDVLNFNKSEIGVNLLNKKLQENPLLMTYTHEPIGISNRTNDTSSTMVGIKNLSESKDLLNENNEIIGYRLVVDFGTSCANGVINCVCLSSNRLGENIEDYKIGKSIPEKNYEGYILSARKNNYYTLDPNYPRFIFENTDKDGYHYCSDNSITVDRAKINITQNYEDFLIDNNLFTINNKKYRIILDDINDLMFTINPKNDTTITLLKYKLSDKTLVSKKDITVPTGFNNDLIDFGFLGDKYIIFINGTLNKTEACYVDYTVESPLLNKDTNTILLPNKMTDSGSQQQFIKGIATYLSAEGGYSCSLVYHLSYEVDSNSYHRTCELYLSNSDNLPKALFLKTVNNRSITTMIHPVYCYPFGIGESCSYFRDSGINKTITSLNISNRAIYSINNLDTPIEKTEDNTMKVTYDITWA